MYLTVAVRKALGVNNETVYITTRTMKHLYDKRPAEEYDSLIYNIVTVIRYPEKIYKNKHGKRGDYCFVTEIKGYMHFTSLEIIDDKIFIVTSFRVSESYLKNYELLWSWKSGESSS